MKASNTSQTPSSPGSLGSASKKARTGPGPIGHDSGFCNALRKTSLSRPDLPTDDTPNSNQGSLPSFAVWPPHLDAHLTKILTADPGGDRGAISCIRRIHPELTEDLIWSRIVYLGLTNRKRPLYRKHEWTAEMDEILRKHYGRSRASTREAIEKILAMDPDWPRATVVWRARVLGLAQRRPGRYQTWTPALDHLLLSMRGCQADTIAKRLNCTTKAILGRLRRLGRNAEFFGGLKTKDLVCELRVSETAVERWIRLGWLRRRKGRITEESLRWLCRHHPDEIPFETLAPETRNWLTLSLDYGRGTIVHQSGRQKAEYRQFVPSH
jgi:hypothetical protein